MQKTLTYRHNTIAYEDTGHGHPVVLLHGFGEDGTVWKHQVPWLADHYRVIVPDWPGSGLSPRATSPSMETFAELLRALLDHERIDQACVIGHSMGGYVLMAFAETYPGYLSGLGLFHSTAFADSEERKQARLRGIAFIRANGAAPFLRQATPNLFADKFKAEHPAAVAAQVERVGSFDPEALIGYYEAMMRRPDRSEVLAGVTTPVLFIGGAKDIAIPLEETLRQVSLPTLAFVHLLEDSAHMGMWEEQAASDKALDEFLTYIYAHA